MSRVYDVVATIGTYEKNGERKFLTRNVGQVIETKKGLRLKMDACFNPAGCMKEEDGSIWLALFTPKEPAQQQQAPRQQQQRQPAKQGPSGSFDDFANGDPGF